MAIIAGKKVPTSMLIIASCVLGIGICLFGLNYWHTMKCTSSHSPEEVEDMIEALNRRLIQAESQVQRSDILMNKVLATMQTNLLKLELSEYDELSKESKDEAIRISLFLATHPAPPMPNFPLDPQFTDAEKLADVIDDVFGKVGEEKSFKEDFMNEYMENEKEATVSLTDAEALKICGEWRDTYKVSIGHSWGDLPYDLQQKWLEYSCDYHMKDGGTAGGGSIAGAAPAPSVDSLESLSD